MKIVQYMLGIRDADGGVVRAVLDLCSALSGRGHEVIALTCDDRDAPRDWDGRDSRPMLQTLKTSAVAPMLLSRSALKQASQLMAGASVVHLHVPWDPICVQLASLARRMSMPYIMSVHGMLDDWTLGKKAAKKRAYLALAGRSMLERAAFVHCTAETERAQSEKWYPRGRTTVAPLPFDLHPYRNVGRNPTTNISDRACRVLFLGRLHPIKRIELLIEAIASSVKRGKPAQLTIAGSGDATYQATLKSKVDHLNLQSCVQFAGFVGGAEKIDAYRHADVMVLPSAHESFGYSAIEAMACGLPVIVTKGVNIWPELAKAGAIVAEPDPHAIAAALDQVAIDGAQRGEQGRRWVFEQFDPVRIAALYEDMYRRAVESPTNDAPDSARSGEVRA